MPGPVPAPARAIAKHLIRRYNPRHLKHFSMRRRPAPLEAASINGPQGPQFFGEVSMAQQLIELKATARPRAGKGAARQARREGKVPAVIYGNGETPLTIVLDYNDLWKQVIKGHFTSTVIDVDVDGKKNRVIPRDLQVDPVKDQPIHVDFMRIGKDGRIRVEVPVRFINDQQSPGLKRGGVLNVVRHELELICDAAKIPDEIHISLAGLEIGDAIHISQVELPEGSKSAIDDRDFTVATVVAPSAMKSEEEETAAPAADAVPTVDEAEGEEGGKEEGGE